jgi:hypothetical protein
VWADATDHWLCALDGWGRIAFAVVGSGPPLVLPAWWVSNVAEDWHFNEPALSIAA